MKIKIEKNSQNKNHYPNSSFFDDSVGFWGEVTGVDSVKNRVRVLSVTGIEFVGLPVASLEWVNKTENYVSGEIRLPPIGSRVFVLMPTGTPAGAFVLCSGFAAGEPSTHELYSTPENKNKNNSIKKRKTQGGWLETENYQDGTKTFESNNGKIKIDIIPNGNDANISISAFNTVISINENDGIVFNSTGSEVKIKNTKKLIVDSTNQDVHIAAKKFTVGNSANNVSLEVN